MLIRPRPVAPLVVCLAAALASLSASAAQGAAGDVNFATMSLKELMALEVFTSASLLPTQASKAPATTYSFTRRDFLRLGVRRLEDLLQFVPGIQLNQYRKRHRAIWARGLIDRYNDKMVLLVDGVRVRHLYYGHFSLGDTFPLERIERVEVVLSPASSLYGANAFGGIISITTRQGRSSAQLEMTMEAGDNERAKSTLFYSNNNFQAFGSYLEQEAPFREDRKSFIGGDVLQPLDEEYTDLLIKTQPLDGLTLALDYSRKETPFLFIPQDQDAYVDEEFLSVSAAYRHGDLENGLFEMIAYYQQDQAEEYEIEQQTRQLAYREYQDAAMAGATATGFRQFDRHTVAAGLAWQLEQAKDMSYNRWFAYDRGFLSPLESGSLLSHPDIRTNDYALFLQDVWQVAPSLDITIGGRYDYFDQFGDYFNHRAAAVYSPDPQQTLKLIYGTAIRTPGFREYLKVLENTTFVPPTPDAERIRSLELGYLYQWQQANLSLAAYHNEVQDFIREFPTPDGGDEYFANDNNTLYLMGVDALLNVRATEALNFRLGVSRQKSDAESVGELPYLAKWSGSFVADYKLWNQHYGLSVTYISGRDDTNNFADDTADAAWVTNLYLSGELSPAMSYRVGIDNLFDKRIYDPAADFGGQYNPERSEREIWLSLQWNLDK